MSTPTEVRPAPAPGACEVIEAVFVYGPQRCSVEAHTQVLNEDDYGFGAEWFYVCDEHATEMGVVVA